MKPLPVHVYDYLKENHRVIPRDFISISRLIALEKWENVTHEDVTNALRGIRDTFPHDSPTTLVDVHGMSEDDNEQALGRKPSA